MGNHAVTLRSRRFCVSNANSGSPTTVGMVAANNHPLLFRRAALNTQNLKWKSR